MLRPYIIERDVIRIIGKRVQMGGSQPAMGGIGDLYGNMDSILGSIPNRVDSRFLGISIDFWHGRKSEQGAEGLHSYMLGAEVTTLVDLPFDLESRVIPASRWLYVPVRYDDPDVKVLAPEGFRDNPGYLTGCIFVWTRRWMEDNGYQRQDFPEDLEIYGLYDGYDHMGGANLTLAVPMV